MLWWFDDLIVKVRDSDQTQWVLLSIMARSFVRNLLEDRCETLCGLRHLSVYFRLDGFRRLFGDATLDNLHQLLDLSVFLTELIDDGMWTVPAAKSGIVASFLVPIFFPICIRCVRVFNQNVELLDLLQHVVIVIGQVLGLFASFLLEAMIQDITLRRFHWVIALADFVNPLFIEVLWSVFVVIIILVCLT